MAKAHHEQDAEEIHQFKELLAAFSRLPRSKETSHKTFFEICGISSREVSYSSFLAFFLNPKEEHGFGDLFLRSLVQASGEKLDTKDFAYVKTEVPTPNGRIDLVIEGASFVLGIENKIGADLYNNLQDYYQHLAGLAKQVGPDKNILPLVLSVKKEEKRDGFFPVSYRAFIEEIQKHLGPLLPLADHRAITYLTDFINSIHHLEKGIRMEDAQVNFFKENEQIAYQLGRKANKLAQMLREKVKNVENGVKPPDVCGKPRRYSSFFDGDGETEFSDCVYYDVKVGDKTPWAVEAALFLNRGWQVYVFAHEPARAADLDAWVKTREIGLKDEFGKWIYAELPFEESEETVAQKCQELLAKVANYLTNKKAR